MSSNEQSEPKKDRSLEGYRGHALKLLKLAQALIGSKIEVRTSDGFETTGLLIPRYEHADENHIVLKIKSGYNLGVDASSVSSISVLEQPRAAAEDIVPFISSKTERKVLLLSTGGTIASKVDYRTGAVHPALSAEDLYVAVPELGEISKIKPEVIFSTYSENLAPLHWQKLAERISDSQADEEIDGIVVMLGTDTLAYVSAALSFALLGLEIPVVCVGSQRSSDRPSSDSALNLKAAVRFAAHSKANGVYVAMHMDVSDDTVAVHLGTRVRKNHTSRRDAFESIDVPVVADVKGSEIYFPTRQIVLSERVQIDDSLKLKTKFEPRASLVKFHPGFDPEVLGYLESRGSKGLVIEGTGLGHVSSQTVAKIADLSKKGVFVGITSQCIWGRVDLNVYDTGRDLLNAGAIPLEDVIAETALAKLSWALGNFPRDMVDEIMKRNLAGESTSRTLPK
ncbi:MAG: Glu-tRNA(Gln) amidotransferase subunit GatD [Nitrososphaerales archaeon]